MLTHREARYNKTQPMRKKTKPRKRSSYTVDVKTLAERILWILAHCRTQTGERWTKYSLSRAARLKSGSHVGAMAAGQLKQVRPATIEAIADTTGVSKGWLMFGEGEPFPRKDRAEAVRHQDSSIVLLKDLPYWVELLEIAKQSRAEMPEWVWKLVAQWRVHVLTPIHARYVIDIADTVFRNHPPPAAFPPSSDPPANSKK